MVARPKMCLKVSVSAVLVAWASVVAVPKGERCLKRKSGVVVRDGMAVPPVRVGWKTDARRRVATPAEDSVSQSCDTMQQLKHSNTLRSKRLPESALDKRLGVPADASMRGNTLFSVCVKVSWHADTPASTSPAEPGTILHVVAVAPAVVLPP